MTKARKFTGEGLKPPVGFTMEIGEDNGPYIRIRREGRGSSGVHHPAKGATVEDIQKALHSLAERVVQSDARNEQRRLERAHEAGELGRS